MKPVKEICKRCFLLYLIDNDYYEKEFERNYKRGLIYCQGDFIIVENSVPDICEFSTEQAVLQEL